jgi:ring-1,2-phenylacetyl-CoA epoxidase subunit PaaE
MKQFYPLTVASKTQETRDAVRIGLDVPAELRDEFAFLPGQHLPIQIEQDGKPLRRCNPAVGSLNMLLTT